MAPRYGIPAPLRSAFAVCHDPGGLLLLKPCDVFRSHTPMRFMVPLPASFRDGPRTSPAFHGGQVAPQRSPGLLLTIEHQGVWWSWNNRSGHQGDRSGSGTPRHSPARPAATIPLSRAFAHHHAAPGCPGQPLRWQATTTRSGWTRPRGCSLCVSRPAPRVTAATGRSCRERILAYPPAPLADPPLGVPSRHVCQLPGPHARIPRGGCVSAHRCWLRGLV
jgi:hypothetical protein